MKKNKFLVIALAAIALLAATSIAAAASLAGAAAGLAGAQGGRPFSTELTGAAEYPAAGDPDGSGTASLTLNPGLEQVCWEISVTGVDPITAAHIHKAAAGASGPPVVFLFPPLPDADGNSSGCIDADRELILDIIQNPEEYYVNVHNVLYPAGALRGQLSK